MLIEFSVGNFLSFKEPVTLSMVASPIQEHKGNIFTSGNLKLLKSAAIYGANASGKSNIIKAMTFMKEFVIDSSKNLQATEDINVEPFRLSTETEHKPSYFQIIFKHNNNRYRYGFEVDSKRVHNEWLFVAPKKVKEKELFIREKDQFSISSSFAEGKDLEEKTRNNALFLSVVAQFNGNISTSIIQWFDRFNVISNSERNNSFDVAEKIEDNSYKEKILNLLRIADIGIDDISAETININNSLGNHLLKNKRSKDFSYTHLYVTKKGLFDVNLYAKHKKYDKNNKYSSTTTFSMEKNESQGTNKFLHLTVPILEALENGETLVVDELESKMHSLLTRFIVDLFNSDINNKNNAQLIFATHDTTLLTKTFLRRDQIWFCSKTKYGSTDLYSLVEYKVGDDKVRNDASYGKDYILGKYGAIPLIGELDLFDEGDDN